MGELTSDCPETKPRTGRKPRTLGPLRANLHESEVALGIRQQTDEARVYALQHVHEAIDCLVAAIALRNKHPKYWRLSVQASKGLIAVTMPAAVQTADGGAVAALEAIRGTAEALRDALKLRLEAGASGLDVSSIRLPGDDPDPGGV